MIKVHYEHPPRKWDFYAKLCLNLLIISLPAVLLAAIWVTVLGWNLSIGIGLAFTLIRWFFRLHTIIDGFIISYDKYLPKEKDCSHLDLPKPASVQSAIETVIDLGFLRLGEAQSYLGMSDKAVTVWLMANPSYDICFEVFEITGIVENVEIMGQFSTWFEGNRRVETAYPFGDNIETDDYLSSSISTSLEAAYSYHLREVAQFEAMYGIPLKIRSLEEFAAFDTINRQTHAAHRMKYAEVRSMVVFTMLNLFLSAVCFMALGLLLAQDTTIPQPNLISAALVVISILGMRFATNIKGRDISQAKKKAA